MPTSSNSPPKNPLNNYAKYSAIVFQMMSLHSGLVHSNARNVSLNVPLPQRGHFTSSGLNRP